jgi:hypothetical protein
VFFALHEASVTIESTLGLRAGSGLWFAPMALIAAGATRGSRARKVPA